MDFKMMEDPQELAEFQFCDAASYSDLLAVQRGELSETEFDKKYLHESAILCLNISGLIRRGLTYGSLSCLLSIVNFHKMVAPVLVENNADHVRAFANDFIALFSHPEKALNVAVETHNRLRDYNQKQTKQQSELNCSIGIGFGHVYRIGVDKAMGDEMNQVSILGEDIARSSETLITERAYTSLQSRNDCTFIKRMDEDIPFVFYEVVFRHKQ